VSTFVYTILHGTKPGRFFDGYSEGDLMVEGYSGSVEAPSMEDACEAVFAFHNQDNRPDWYKAPSLSVGDVVLVDGLANLHDQEAFACRDMGFEWVEMPENVERTKSYLEVLREKA
jgi:hypothetical protein